MTSMTEVMNGKRVCPRRLRDRDKVLFFFDKTAPQSVSSSIGFGPATSTATVRPSLN
jgi:hypothetical protein